jgi:hypothetical protein
VCGLGGGGWIVREKEDKGDAQEKFGVDRKSGQDRRERRREKKEKLTIGTMSRGLPSKIQNTKTN